MPDLCRLSLLPLSESFFLLALVLALWAGSSLERAPTGRALVIFLLAFAVAFHVRTMGVVLGAAIPVALLLRRRRDPYHDSLAAVVRPGVPRHFGPTPGHPRPLWRLVHAAGELGGGDGVGSLSLLGRFGGVLFPGTEGPWVLVLSLVAVGVGGVGVYRLSRESWAPVLTAGFMVGLLWLWPYQERRLVMPVAPLMGLILICGFRVEVRGTLDALWGRAARVVPSLAHTNEAGVQHAVVRRPSESAFSKIRATALSAVALIWIVWLGGGSLLHLNGDRHLDAYSLRTIMLARVVLAVEGRVPEDGVVGAPELWAGIALHTGRTVAPSARFHPVGEGPVWGNNQEQFEVWQAAGIEYVVLENAGRVHKEAVDELDVRCPEAVELIASWGGGMLIRLDWDDQYRTKVLIAP